MVVNPAPFGSSIPNFKLVPYSMDGYEIIDIFFEDGVDFDCQELVRELVDFKFRGVICGPELEYVIKMYIEQILYCLATRLYLIQTANRYCYNDYHTWYVWIFDISSSDINKLKNELKSNA